ncbi:putative ribonuclease H-like domain-containing protein [Tanacetum coccineum]
MNTFITRRDRSRNCSQPLQLQSWPFSNRKVDILIVALQTTTNADGTPTSLIPGLVTTEEKVQKKNDVKARSMLLMALLNEHLMAFNQYKDAKTLFCYYTNKIWWLQKIISQLAILASQQNGSQLVCEDLEQIHEDDLEEMDLKWLLALLSMRIGRFSINSGRKILFNGSGHSGYDKYMERESRTNSRRTINVEETSSKAMVAIDGPGFDWIYMVDDEVPTNMALMAFLNSKSVSEYISNEVRESPHASLVEELVSNDKLKKKTIFPTIAKIEFVRPKQQEKPVRKLVKYAEMYRSQNPRGNQRNWNNQKSQQLGSDFMMVIHKKKIKAMLIVDAQASKDETSGILKSFITEIENLVDKKVKIIRCDNGTEFKNRVMSEFCEKKGIKKEFSVARTPQQNGVAKRRNRTLIEAARTMLADCKLPTTFWVEAVNIACYVQNKVLVVKPHNKTPYELFRGRTPALSFMRPFGCHVTILNTLDYLGKFDGKSDEGFFVGYSLNSKAFRVYNIRTRKVEENLHIRFLEDKPIIAGDGPKWLFDIDVLTKSMNYVPVVAGTNSNDFVGTEESIGAGYSSKETGSSQDYILMPLWKDGSLFDSSSKNASNDEPQPSSDAGKKDDGGVSKESRIDDQERPKNSTQDINTAGPSINIASANDNTSSLNINSVSPTVTTTRLYGSQTEPDMFSLGDNATLEATHDEFFGDATKVDISNITTTYPIPFVPTTRIHKDHPLEQEEPKRIAKALSDPSWVKAMQEELLQFKLQKVWVLVNLPKGKRVIGTKWIFRNKKDERGIVIQNKARLVEQGYTQEEDIDYDEVFAPVARIEAIRLFLAYASFMGFMVYRIDVKSAFLYGRIEGEVYVDDIIFCSTKKELCTKFEKLMHDKFHMSSMGELTFFLGLFNLTDVRTASTPMDTEKALLKDSDGDDVDVHLYRSMIGSLMYLTSSRPDIMFAVCACARFQITPKVSHLHAVKRIFRYLKGHSKLGLWCPKDSSFDLVAYSDSDYVGASLDRKFTTRGCQFLGCRLISWQCKKQIVVATSSTKVEYVAAASCCGQGLIFQGEGSTVPVDSHHTPTGAPSTSQPHLLPTLRSSIRQETEVSQPSSPPHINVADEAASTGVDVRHGGAATTVTSLDAG